MPDLQQGLAISTFPDYIYEEKRANFKSQRRNDLKMIFEKIASGSLSVATQSGNHQKRSGSRFQRAIQSTRRDF